MLLAQTHETELTQSLATNEEKVKNLESTLSTTQETLQETQRQLEEADNRLRAMEEDAGAEFRSKVRLLERKLSDANSKVCYGWMDGWMDGWTDGWMDGWMDGWTDRQING